jgi:hypothetical protein
MEAAQPGPYALFLAFGMSSWLLINGVFLELPNLARLPEGGWAAPTDP